MQLQSFAGVPFNGFLQLPGEKFPLSEGVLNSCMQQCVAAVGLQGAYGSALKGHSCRSGGISALHALGGSIPLATARGGWQSVATVFQHYLSFEVLPSKEAFLLLGFLLPLQCMQLVGWLMGFEAFIVLAPSFASFSLEAYSYDEHQTWPTGHSYIYCGLCVW
jgi:hypothetical protein